MSNAGISSIAAATDRFRSWGATHTGTVRTYNEDGFVNRPDLGLWAVADGAGGHQAGNVASGAVVQALEAIPCGLSAAELLAEVRHCLQATHAALHGEGRRRGGGALVATTVVVLIVRDGHYACLWAGDSRAYLWRGGTLTQVSEDHSLVQELVSAGAITEAEAERHPHANIITRAVGADGAPLELDKVTDRLASGDRFLLCSDGLCKALAAPVLAEAVGADESAAAERLIKAALTEKANDNVTAVVVEVLDDPSDITGATIPIFAPAPRALG